MSMVNVKKSSKHFLLEVTPSSDNSPQFLKQWISDNRTFLDEKISEHGGVLFKGFAIQTGRDFEEVALSIDEKLTDKHVFDGAVGTKRTPFVSDVANPDIKKVLTPLSQHNEDSFVSHVAPKIMFCSLNSAPWGGESLIADCRKVYDSLPKKIQNKYHRQKLVSTLNLEDKLFLANSLIPKNVKKITEFGKAQGADVVKRITYDVTQFLFTVRATITSKRGEDVWFNTLHQSVWYNDCVDIWMAYKALGGTLNRIRSVRLILHSLYKNLINSLKARGNPLKMHTCTFANGQKITAWERLQMGLAFWKNTVVLPLEDGDFFVLDNRLVSHGRMPYKGRRLMVSAMTKPECVL